MPRILDMHGKMSGRDEDDIDPDIFASLRKSWREYFGSSGDATKTVIIDSMIEFSCCSARFNFDKSDEIAALCNDIDFAGRCADPLREDTPAFDAQPHCSISLAFATARFGSLALHGFRASARA